MNKPISKIHGHRGAVHCPFHEEKTASCIVDVVKNTFRCLSCGKSGVIIKHGNRWAARAA